MTLALLCIQHQLQSREKYLSASETASISKRNYNKRNTISMAMIKCPECGHQVSDKAEACPSCGVRIAGNVKKCSHCGAVVFNEQTSCPECHSSLADNLANGQPAASEQQQQFDQPQQGEDGETVETSGSQRKKPMIAVAVAVVVVVIACAAGAYFYSSSQSNDELAAYESAMESTEPAVLQNYLDMYKDAPAEHRDSIQAHLALMSQADQEWTNAVLSGSKTAIERYLQLHPGTIHATEAKLKIDSLDWVAASKADTPDAYQAYMNAHSDGLYYDQAKDGFDKSNARQVTPADKQDISRLFNGFFSALAANDADALTGALANVMDDFLHKANATKNDAVTYMHKIHSEAGDGALEFRTNNDWKIEKKETSGGDGYEYSVEFSVDQKNPGKDGGQPTITSNKVEAKVSSDLKITSLNMKRMVQ